MAIEEINEEEYNDYIHYLDYLEEKRRRLEDEEKEK